MLSIQIKIVGVSDLDLSEGILFHVSIKKWRRPFPHFLAFSLQGALRSWLQPSTNDCFSATFLSLVTL